MLIENRLEWLEAVFGIAGIAAVAVPFSTWSKPAELGFLLMDSAVQGLFAIDAFGGQDAQHHEDDQGHPDQRAEGEDRPPEEVLPHATRIPYPCAIQT